MTGLELCLSWVGLVEGMHVVITKGIQIHSSVLYLQNQGSKIDHHSVFSVNIVDIVISQWYSYSRKQPMDQNTNFSSLTNPALEQSSPCVLNKTFKLKQDIGFEVLLFTPVLSLNRAIWVQLGLSFMLDSAY